MVSRLVLIANQSIVGFTASAKNQLDSTIGRFDFELEDATISSTGHLQSIQFARPKEFEVFDFVVKSNWRNQLFVTDQLIDCLTMITTTTVGWQVDLLSLLIPKIAFEILKHLGQIPITIDFLVKKANP